MYSALEEAEQIFMSVLQVYTQLNYQLLIRFNVESDLF